MKSEVFNASRFGAYFKYDFTQLWRNHVKAAVGIGLMGLIFYVFFVILHMIFHLGEWQAPGLTSRIIVFGIACLALQLYQTRTYGYLTDKRKGAAWLTVPASSFEKWLSMMLLTLLVVPFIFLVAYFLTDSILAFADSTMDTSIVGSLSGGVQKLQDKIIGINQDYMTSWSLGPIVGLAIALLCVNTLYFLLCGICFRKNKLLMAFAIVFGLALVTVIILQLIPSSDLDFAGYEDPAEGERHLRALFYTITVGSWALAAGLAAAIYFRIRTLKH